MYDGQGNNLQTFRLARTVASVRTLVGGAVNARVDNTGVDNLGDNRTSRHDETGVNNVGVDNVGRRSKGGHRTTREWTSRHDETGVNNAGVDNVGRRSKGGQRGSGQGGTKKQG